MSTNLRKAQKHMQRARELLNPESQLGFGVTQDKIPETEGYANQGQQGASWFMSLSSQIRKEFIAKDLECATLCRIAGAHPTLRGELGPTCETCSEPYRYAFNN